MRIQTDQPLPDNLIARLQSAKHVAVLTGAGVSAESGIPTFRDAQTGLWANYDPMMLASPDGFASDPELVWNWYQWRRELIAQSDPNPGHFAIAEMERKKTGFDLITQNVDGLHQMAGSKRGLELHGNIQRTICSITRKPISAAWLRSHPTPKPPPSPHAEQGLGRPDVVWFGEALNADVVERAIRAARLCDLMIVAGTAGTVHPAASLPMLAKQDGALVMDINPEQSEISLIADWHLQGKSADWLPDMAKAFSA